MKLNHLDLFSGIGGFHLGFEKAGFEVNSYFSEVDKYAIDVYKNNFKNSTYVGSVTDVRGTKLPNIDAITFGSPCQDFSMAGKRKGMQGQRSSLITEAIRLIDECRPRFFIWENVKGTFSSNNGADFWAIIQAFANIGGYRLEWQLLNTKWFLPQNRERIYLVGYLGNGSGGQVFPIRESSKQIDELQRQQANTCTLTTRYGADGNGSYLIERKLDAQEEIIVRGGLQKNAALMTNLSPSLTSAMGMGGGHTPIIKIKSATTKGYEIAQQGDSINYSVPTSKTRRGRVGKGVAQTLDTACNQGVFFPRYNYKKANDIVKNNKHNLNKGESKMLDFYNNKVQDVSPCLTDPKHNNVGLFDGYKIRRLTPIECERLQGFPDNWTQYGTQGLISDTQRYKMCGNAVTVDVVEAVAKNIIKVIK